MNELSLTEKDNGQKFIIPPETKIIIMLPENAATGYQWTPEILPEDIIVLEKKTFIEAAESGIGATGTIKFNFRTIDEGNGRISLKYWQEWEGEKSIAKRFEIHVNIQ